MHAPQLKTAVQPPLTVLEPDARTQNIPEAVIQDLWHRQQFQTDGLKTSDGSQLTVINPGTLNTDSGADFSGACITLASGFASDGVLEWTGDIEVHRSSGEWLLHRHHEDPRYNRVVLHVVLLEDRYTGSLRRSDGTLLPELVLYPLLDSSLRSLLHQFYTQRQKHFYCEKYWHEVDEKIRMQWIMRLGRHRVRAKGERLLRDAGSVNEALYQSIFRALGYAKNADAMTRLARLISWKTVQSLENQADVEAMLFGTAGLLPDLSAMMHTDRHSIEYVIDLRDRYERVNQRFQVMPMRSVEWQYFRLRPANFPTRRIAQTAALFSQASAKPLVSVFVNALHGSRPVQALRQSLMNATPSAFWNEHVRFEQRTSAKNGCGIGKRRIDRILMDAVLPILLAAAEGHLSRSSSELVLKTIAAIPSASDSVTKQFEQHGNSNIHALATQGLHELYRNWCTKGRCLACNIGSELHSSNSNQVFEHMRNPND